MLRAPHDRAEKLAWLRLIRSENVGPITFFKLLSRFGNAASALDALPELAKRGGRGGGLRICPAADAEEEWHRLESLGGMLVAWGESTYPPLLGHIPDPPPLLSVLGQAALLKKRAVALVGARNASSNGRTFAKTLASELGDHGLLVVSGMARGIDAAAHEGALAKGTVAVLGGGVDVVYPRENASLYDRLKETGAVISEVPPGTTPQARHFPRRNRLISGMARGVAVIEAGLRSGSLITARLALEQGREVFAVPGSPLDPRARGTNKLIRDGAALTESADDILAILGTENVRLREPDRPEFAAAATPQADDSELDGARAKILEALGPAPTTVDELLRNCQFSQAVASGILLELELAGRLERHPGGKVSLILGP